MSTSALPPTSTEMLPSPYHSVLQKVSQPYRTAWIVWKPSAQFASSFLLVPQVKVAFSLFPEPPMDFKKMLEKQQEHTHVV